jgi:hypothetical protein
MTSRVPTRPPAPRRANTASHSAEQTVRMLGAFVTEDLSAVPEVVVRFAAEQVGVDPVDVVMEDAEEV